jgi:hypothetical protein
MHSYNFLAHLANRDIPVPLELKSIPEYKLVAMIEKEGDNPLIFPDHVLNGFHVVFIDGFIWASTDVKSFKDWFRMVPRGKPIIKEEMITYFCYAVSLLDEYRDKEICPNMEDWYSALTGKKTLFSKLKGNAVGPNKNEVDRRMEHFTRFLNG